MRSLVVRLLSMALPLAVAAAGAEPPAKPSDTVFLWPGAAPGDKGDIGEEKDTTPPDGRKVDGRHVTRLGNVSKPSITLFPAPAGKNTGAAVLVCPGGGYNILAWDLEGVEVCEWLNSIGVNGVLLKYRVPARKGQERHLAPLQDAQRAMGLVRQRAAEWGIDPRRIGVLGFSAGGHLAATLSNNFDKRAYGAVDDADSLPCRPDFAVLVYPAYLTLKDRSDQLSPEVSVTSNTPPTFLVQTQDDNVRVECSLFYYLALKNAKVSAEMHLYSSGGHGYGLRPSGHTVTTWPRRVEEWLGAMNLLKPAGARTYHFSPFSRFSNCDSGTASTRSSIK